MNRGPLPQKGIDIAMPIALARGFVIFCRHYYGYVCDFVIAEPGRTSIVRMFRTKRLYDTVAGMAGQFRTGIAGLSRVLPDICRSLEIWACDYYGNLRFFRLRGTGLVEIRQDGTLLDPAAVASGAGEEPSPVSIAGETPSHPTCGEEAPGTDAGEIPGPDGGKAPG
jgi:hypothetical protein